MQRFLERHLKIYSHEFARFTWIAAIFLAVFFVTAIFRNYVDTAFLKRYGPDYIPWMMAISAVLTMVVLGFADQIAKRLSDDKLLSGFLGIYAVAAAACFFMVKEGLSITYPILYQLMGLLDAILLVYLWNIAGDLFDARQGKRIFPFVTAAQVLGTTIGSFLTRPITHVLGEDSTLLVFGAVFIATSLFMNRTSGEIVGNAIAKAKQAGKPSAKKRLAEVPAIMKQFPIIRFLVIGGLVPNILLPIFSYQFNVIANQSFASEQSLITFLSVFRGCTTLVTFVILFFVGRLYSQMGLPNASLAHPVNFTVLFGSLTMFFNIYVAAYGQFTVVLIQRAIAGPVNKILFNVIPKDLRAWARTFISGTVLKVAMLAGSVTMIVLKPVLDARDFSYIAVVLAVYWIVETLAFRKEYKRVLKQVIVEGKIDFDEVEAVRTFDAGGAPMGLESRAAYRPADEQIEEPGSPPRMAPDVALKLLDDPEPSVRAAAALSFAGNPEPRAVKRLVKCLEDTNEKVSNAALEALTTYPPEVLTFLEASLLQCSLRGKLGILEVIRMSPNLHEFEMAHLLGRSIEEAYQNLLVIRQLQRMNQSQSVNMLTDHLLSKNDEILRLVFYGLWVYHADMRLMYQALKSDSAAVAVEMVETTVRGDNVPYLLPLIDDVPLDEKIEKGRKLFNLVERASIERLLTLLTQSPDPVTRMLALTVMGDLMPNPALVPVIDSCLDDEDRFVRQMARYALERDENEEAPMPEVFNILEKLKSFALFEGLGTRELHAVASVVKQETFKLGDILIRPGDESRSIYLVISGQVTVFSGYGTTDQREVFVNGPGGYSGFIPMFADAPPTNTSVATADTEVFMLHQSQFQEIIRVYPAIALNLLRISALQFRKMGLTA